MSRVRSTMESGMSRNLARVLGGVLAVAVAWIAIYWWMSPSPPKISFGGTIPTSATAKAPPAMPRSPVEIVDIKRPAPKPAPVPIATRAETRPVPAPALVEPPVVKPQAATPARPAAVIPPRFSDYTVKPNDTLNSIATMELGSNKYTDALRRANPLKDLDKLKAGDVIRIPADPSNIQGKPAADSPPPAPPASRQGEMLEYTVKSGDTLTKIAKDKYGSTSYQDLIYQANRDRLKSPSSLKEGQKLRLPPKP